VPYPVQKIIERRVEVPMDVEVTQEEIQQVTQEVVKTVEVPVPVVQTIEEIKEISQHVTVPVTREEHVNVLVPQPMFQGDFSRWTSTSPFPTYGTGFVSSSSVSGVVAPSPITIRAASPMLVASSTAQATAGSVSRLAGNVPLTVVNMPQYGAAESPPPTMGQFATSASLLSSDSSSSAIPAPVGGSVVLRSMEASTLPATTGWSSSSFLPSTFGSTTSFLGGTTNTYSAFPAAGANLITSTWLPAATPTLTTWSNFATSETSTTTPPFPPAISSGGVISTSYLPHQPPAFPGYPPPTGFLPPFQPPVGLPPAFMGPSAYLSPQRVGGFPGVMAPPMPYHDAHIAPSPLSYFGAMTM
jgi:hypothetical protein